jgi:hypothetical protein
VQGAEKEGLAIRHQTFFRFWLLRASSMPVLRHTPTTLEAEVGIGRLKRVFSPKNAHFYD